MRFDFVFTIHGFDEDGQEHRLRSCAALLTIAVDDLVRFAAKLMRCSPDHLAAKRIRLKSAWQDDNAGKRRRITGKQLLEALLAKGLLATKGRGDQSIEKVPQDYGRRR